MQVRYLGLSLLLLTVFWQLLVMVTHWPSFLLPSPLTVIQSLHEHATQLLAASLPTLTETILGLITGILCGALFALCLALLPRLRTLCLPLLILSQALPIFVLAPLLTLWFGFGMLSKIMVIILMLFFPVASALDDGLHRTPKEQLEYAASVNCRPFRLLFSIKFPNALPVLVTGLKLSACYAPMGAIIAEWVGASHGLGALLLQANTQLDTPLVFATTLVIITLTLIVYGLMQLFCSYLLKKLI